MSGAGGRGGAPPPCIGVLLAAGRSRRMGRTKQLLPWPTPSGAKPLVAAAFDAIAPACQTMIVVLGHEAEAVAAALAPRRFEAVPADADAPMYESIRAGLGAARRLDARASALLHPADHPQVDPATLRTVIDTAARNPGRAIMPVYGGAGGHPVLIPADLIDHLLAFAGEGGLRRYWQDHPDDCIRLAVDDPFVVRDLDTPDDWDAKPR